jgi:hypothetical protein
MRHGDSDNAVTVRPGKTATLPHTFDRAGTVEIGCHGLTKGPRWPQPHLQVAGMTCGHCVPRHRTVSPTTTTRAQFRVRAVRDVVRHHICALGGIRTPNLLIRSRATDVCLMRCCEVIAGHAGAAVWRVRLRLAIFGGVDGQADGQHDLGLSLLLAALRTALRDREVGCRPAPATEEQTTAHLAKSTTEGTRQAQQRSRGHCPSVSLSERSGLVMSVTCPQRGH